MTRSAPSRRRSGPGRHWAMELDAFRTALDAWLGSRRGEVAPTYAGAGTLDQEMAQVGKGRRLTLGGGWARWGWPEGVGGFGGPALLRACLSAAIPARDLVEPGLYSM